MRDAQGEVPGLFNVLVASLSCTILAALWIAWNTHLTPDDGTGPDPLALPAGARGVPLRGAVPASVSWDGDLLLVDLVVGDAVPHEPPSRYAPGRDAMPRVAFSARVEPGRFAVVPDARGLDWVEVTPRGAEVPLEGAWPIEGVDPSVPVEANRVTLHVRSASLVAMPR